jgi:hypothetical protein
MEFINENVFEINENVLEFQFFSIFSSAKTKA